jgi:MFS family permease
MLARFGNRRYILTAIFFEFLAVLGLSFAINHILVAILFIVHVTLVAMISFNLDVFLEESTKEEKHTGELRGSYLTLANLTLVVSPTIVGLLLVGNNFSSVYLLSALVSIPLFFIAYKRLKVPESPQSHVSLRETFTELGQNKNIRSVTFVQLVLNFFFAWMVVYMPIYLNEVIGFSWSELGVLFSVMLLPFVLFDMPVGWLADRSFGEKEFMITGITIIALSMLLVPFIVTKSFALWATLLFISRVGASFVEVTTESFFFKHVGGRDANVISFFRMTRPLSFIITPVVFALTLSFVSFVNSFFILGGLTFLGVTFARNLIDTH